MNTAERRGEILKILHNADAPVAARELAGKFGVSRQVIVQDLAVIRASTPGILSTTKGYVIQQDSSCSREFKVRHSQDKAAEELNLIVDCGGHVKNISISHRVYGRVSAEMDIRSRQDVSEFVQALQNSHSTVLSNATSGYHYHLVEAASEERLELIEEQLKKAGFLAPLQPWEILNYDSTGNSAGDPANEKRTGCMYSGTCLPGTGNSGSSRLHGRFLWTECAGIQE